jgi:hypothetical protein
VLLLSSLISSKPYNFSCFYVCMAIYKEVVVRYWSEFVRVLV